ncbi:MAG: 2-hydroxyacyl-CoA dehydratase [Bacteroidales bacterium]|nr:2-hydroxyacyl-CoA dehydratase [Bacteroidales bacterium]
MNTDYTNVYIAGLDVGSTTAKIVVADDCGNTVYSTYRRHNADIKGTVKTIFSEIRKQLGNINLKLTLSGSAAMGLSERCSLSFIQEVAALNNFAKNIQDDLHTIIDIGGEDAKIIFLEKDALPDMRMNGNCAGGTGAFIDQMSAILNMSIQEMDYMSQKSTHLYPIASRCGVFSKTDVQNLVARNVPVADICASIFHAIAVQVVSALSRGKEIKEKILLAGGPLSFISSLRKAFLEYLNISEDALIQSEDNNLLVARGCLYSKNAEVLCLDEIEKRISEDNNTVIEDNGKNLQRLFSTQTEYEEWKTKKQRLGSNDGVLTGYNGKAYLGIDSGSTTTKIVLIDEQEHILFKYYNKNNGNPINAVIKGLQQLKETLSKENANPVICGGCSTGYGEDLIKAAFSFDSSIVETIAHYKAAKKILPSVDFILDIGGQDMKAMYIEDGVLNRIELNEACSSGCGTFIDTFATGLGYKIEDFAHLALFAEHPCDLGTRCTVFMNSKVKQFLREGRLVGDISSGLSYSVVRNCLYKVLKLEGKSLGENIVVQGGTMRNDSVVRALEIMLDREVYRSDCPELMGAYGCALQALSYQNNKESKQLDLDEMIKADNYTAKNTICKGCQNNCTVTSYKFANNNIFHSGNRCEKIFNSSAKASVKGDNIYHYKYKRLFGSTKEFEKQKYDPSYGKKEFISQIGIPRALNMFEDYPFWKAMFENLNIKPVLSDISEYASYEKSLNQVMSENICFPAKLTHSHIDNLISKGIKHIFFPYIVYEKNASGQENNTYNCPIVSSYNVIIKHLKEKHKDIIIDNPVFSFKDEKLLKKNCKEYFTRTFNISAQEFEKAFSCAVKARKDFEEDIYNKNIEFFNKAKANHQLIILLAGRPYHTDDLIQHSLANIASHLGATVINEDIARKENYLKGSNSFIVSQWSYINRIENAAFFVANQSEDVHYAQMTSFGCGPDAFLLDDVQDILKRHHKSATFLKIDDIQNTGSLKLRIRSLIESIKLNNNTTKQENIPFIDTKDFSAEEKHRTILAPFFTDYISPFLPELFKINGYDLEVLPKSNEISAEEGLKYANNEVCYPATLIVGDVIKALKSGKYDLSKVAVGIPQTGGQCRATNYYAIIRKALVDAGFKEVPVMSVSFGENTAKKQDGFRLNWKKTLPLTLSTILFGDSLSRLYCSTIVRCKKEDKLKVKDLHDTYITRVKALILKEDRRSIDRLLEDAVSKFNAFLPAREQKRPKVGIVGEIYLKYHSFANHDVSNWLMEQGIEIIPPSLMTFFVQTFVNRKVNKQYNIEKQSIPSFVMDFLYKLVKKRIDNCNKVMKQFRYYHPLENVFELASKVEGILPLYTQFGEGWLLPAEIVNMVQNGINTVVSLQPFGCIANHIISKGVENKIKEMYPKLNYLALDFDNSVTPVNIKNRLLLMLESIEE